jgi:starch synthase
LIDRPLRHVVKYASKVFAGSPMELPLLEKLNIPPHKVSIVTNGVNEYFLERPTAAQMNAVQSKFDLPATKDGEQLVGLYLGNHTQNKGLPVLLEALAQVTAPYMMIVGGKRRSTIDYEGHITRCGVGQRLIFTDWISDEEMLALAHYAEIFIFPTLADTLPLVVLEAMACGLPILSTTVGGIPYQVDASCGQLVPPGDVLALRTAIEQFSKDKARLKPMGAAARQKVQRQFRWQQSAEVAFAEYASLCLVRA